MPGTGETERFPASNLTGRRVVEIDQDVMANYRALKVERGLSWEQMATQAARSDANLAAWFRAQAAQEQEQPKPNDEPDDDIRHAPVPVKGPKRTAQQK